MAISWSVAPGYEETYAKVLVSLVDLTQHKQAAEALQESERQYRELAQQNAQLYAETQQRLKDYRNAAATQGANGAP